MADVMDWGLEALEKLKSTEPPVFLAPSSRSEVARVASRYLFTKLKPHNPKSPFDELLIDGFDAEQIWQQIDLQSQPLLSSLRHEVRRFSKNPQEIRKLGNLAYEDDVHEIDMDNDNDDEDEDNELEADESGGEEDGENEGIEDKFFKIKDLEDFLEEGEAQEYGIDYKAMSKVKKQYLSDDDEEDEEFGAFAGEDNEESNKSGKARAMKHSLLMRKNY